MKLRNKKTGEIVEPCGINLINGRVFVRFDDEKGTFKFEAHSLAELNAEWEDYEESKEWYWFIEDNGIIQRSCHYVDLHPTLDEARKDIGNYFETKEEAEKAVEKLKAWKRLKDKGFRFNGGDAACISYDTDIENWSMQDLQDFATLFGGKE